MKKNNVVTMPIAVDLQTVADMLAISVSTVESLVRQGDFPKPRKMSGRRVGWLVREVTAWAESRPAADMLPPPLKKKVETSPLAT